MSIALDKREIQQDEKTPATGGAPREAASATVQGRQS